MEKINMAQYADKILVCRQCGKEFHFTGAEQEFYTQKGWTEPGHCPQCRSARRKREDMHLICSGCSILLEKEEPVYCSKCVENLKLEAELMHQGQLETIKEFEGKLENLGEMEQRLASVTMELEKIQQANIELKDKIAALHEAASWGSLKDSLQHVNKQLGAFEQSYACDIDKLTGLLLEVQHALTQKREPCLWHRMRMAFTGKTGSHEAASGKANNLIVPSAQGYPENTSARK
jgi:predicted ATPase